MNFSAPLAEELSASELCANLRIIAKDAPSLSKADRDIIAGAANELEIAYRQLVLDNINLCALSAANSAQALRIAELAPKLAWSMSGAVGGRLG